MMRHLTIGVAVTLMVGACAASALGEPFFVEMRDGSFKRCGNLSFRKERAEWRLQDCEAMARVLAGPVATAKPTPRPTASPRPTNDDPCPGGCIVWDPVTDTTTCKRPCPK